MITEFQELYHDCRYDDVVFMEGSHHVGIGFRKMLLRLDKQNFYTFTCRLRYE